MSLQTVPPDTTDHRPNRPEDAQALEADVRLRDDIRLLGRILGDTVRDQEGAELFDLVERIRQTSIRFHRDEDRLARRELEQILDSMSTSETVRIVRAFSYFSHLANIAEDQNNIRQMRARSAAQSTGSGVLAETLAHARDAGISSDVLRNSLQDRAGQPGPDRAPDRGPSQEHHGSRDGGRGIAGPPRACGAD
ncbi:phosphoenolpyruvate carboxylase [Bradyrhizobium sp. i1.4.4]